MAPNDKTAATLLSSDSKVDNEEQCMVKEVLFEGNFYDVTNFVDKHPGGSIIEYYTNKGEDATQAIQQFHQRSIKKIRVMLSGFKKRPARDEELLMSPEQLKKHKAMTEDFAKLYLELEKEGMFEPNYLHNICRVLELTGIGLLGYYLLFFENIIVKIFGAALIGLAAGRSGWIQHEAGHHSITGNPWFDRHFHAVIYGICYGLSSTWWAGSHNRHHAMPQRVNFDYDLQTMPYVAYNIKVVKNPEEGKSFFVQNQVYLGLLIDPLLLLFHEQFWRSPIMVFKNRFYVQGFSILIHYFLAYYIGFWPWLFSRWITSMYLFSNFALSHTHLPVTTEPTHWVEYSLIHTADVEPSWWCNWWMGYLNFQIEHHLFPTMPQFRHPLIQDRVIALAKKHNLPFHVLSYSEAIRKTVDNLREVALELQKA